MALNPGGEGNESWALHAMHACMHAASPGFSVYCKLKSEVAAACMGAEGVVQKHHQSAPG